MYIIPYYYQSTCAEPRYCLWFTVFGLQNALSRKCSGFASGVPLQLYMPVGSIPICTRSIGLPHKQIRRIMSRRFFLPAESVLRLEGRPSDAVLLFMMMPAQRDCLIVRSFRAAAVYRAVGRINSHGVPVTRVQCAPGTAAQNCARYTFAVAAQEQQIARIAHRASPGLRTLPVHGHQAAFQRGALQWSAADHSS